MFGMLCFVPDGVATRSLLVPTYGIASLSYVTAVGARLPAGQQHECEWHNALHRVALQTTPSDNQ